MTKKAFDKIAAGIHEAIAIVRGEAEPARWHIPAEAAVLDSLRMLQAMHQPHADRVMDKIAREFLDSSRDSKTARRRAHALLRIAAGALE